MLSDLPTRHVRDGLGVDDEDRLGMAVAHLVNGLIGVLTWWLDARPDLSARRVFTDFEHLVVEELGPQRAVS
ncbi:hypothetical protein [Streptomyces sp. NPDC047315]|uniref:hypothetical protein n=1 Tax=Streptomyces sp. NPDC047315 TaxID=3155142 RepID=UPI0033E46C70